ARDDVLRRLVEERRTGIVLCRPLRPDRREHLVRLASEQDRLAAAHQLGNRLTHFGVEAELHCPGRRVDDAVQRRELMDEDLAHQNPYRSSRQGSASLWYPRRSQKPGWSAETSSRPVSHFALFQK